MIEKVCRVTQMLLCVYLANRIFIMGVVKPLVDELKESFVFRSISTTNAANYPNSLFPIGFPASYIEPNEEETSWKVRITLQIQICIIIISIQESRVYSVQKNS